MPTALKEKETKEPTQSKDMIFINNIKINNDGTARIYYRDTKHRIDLTNLHEALHDAMVKANLLLDDNRDLIAGTDGSRVFYDKARPRIEVKITEMKDYTQWNDTTSKQQKLI